MKNLLLILFFFVIFSCNKKIKFIKTKRILSEIDSLNTKKEIEQLVGKIDSLYQKIEIKPIQDITFRNCNDSIIKELAKRKNVNFELVKVDFDNNGLVDVLFIGNNKTYTNENCNPKLEVEFSKEYNTLVLMNYGKNKYKLLDVSEDKYYPIVPQVIIEQSQCFLRIFKPKILNSRKIVKRYETVSKMTFKFDHFIEYNPNPAEYNIEKIEFASKGCAGTCPAFNIAISDSREALINAKSFNYSSEWQKGKFMEGNYSAIIKENDFKKLKNLLVYLDFPTLKNNYSLVSFHHPEGKLTITYNGGKVKTINDFGLVGTYGLKRAYNMLANFRFNQNWKKQVTDNKL